MMTQRQARIQFLEIERRQHQSKVDELSKEIAQLRLEQQKEEHPCTCVKLNGDIEIYDMAEQARRNRNPLSCGGFVAHSLSARKDCPYCQGTGKPKKE